MKLELTQNDFKTEEQIWKIYIFQFKYLLESYMNQDSNIGERINL